MTMTNAQEIPAPPRLIPALVAGFDAITNHISVILFPIIFDIMIWLAPHLRLNRLIEQLLGNVDLVSSNQSAELTDMFSVGREAWLQIADQLNLAIAIRSYPIGIPSLMVSSLPSETPFSTPILMQIPSLRMAFFIVISLMGIGLIAGTLYYQVVAQAAVSDKILWKRTLLEWPRLSLRVILLAFVWMSLLIFISIPASCFISLALLAGFSIGQLAILLYGGLVIWLIFPLLFSTHGIILKNLTVWPSIRLGIRITNATLPTTVLFFLSIFVLTQGLDMLWRIPPSDSWFSLLGIAGHGFVVTGLLSASFIYYRDADRWITSIGSQQSKSTSNSI